MKFGIVHDVVQVSLGADEEVFPHSVADVGANMKEKMISVKVGSATYGEIATAGGTIKEDPLAADATLGGGNKVNYIQWLRQATVEKVMDDLRSRLGTDAIRKGRGLLSSPEGPAVPTSSRPRRR